MTQNKGLHRRTFLKNVGLAAVAQLAGCTKVLPAVSAFKKTIQGKTNYPNGKGSTFPITFNPIPGM